MSEQTPAIFHKPKPAMISHVEWTDAGLERYKAMKNDIHMVGSYYGPKSEWYVAESFLHCISTLFTCGPCNVQSDGNGLLITTEWIVMGMVWHPASLPTVEMLTGMGADDLDPTWPQIGTWSLNS